MKSLLEVINEDQRKVFMELLPLNIALNITIPVIFEEQYWERKCIAAKWNYVHYWINNCSWRDAFVCHFVEEAIDNFLAKNRTFEQMTVDLEVFGDHLKRVKINGYKGNFVIDSSSEVIPFEESVGKLFTFFPNLEEIYLNNAPIEYVVCNDKERPVNENNLFKTIHFLKKLIKITIIGYSLKDKHLSMLTDYLLSSRIECLNLSCNLMKNDSCSSLKSVLKSQHLTTLILSNNCIGNTGINMLLSVLCDNNTLRSLNLSKNDIADEGAIAIADFLKIKFVLHKLDISFNKFGYRSGMAFNDVLKLNSTLLCLNLSGNILGKEVGKMFAESVSTNKSIRYLGVEFCDFEEQEEDIIYSRIHLNTTTDDYGLML